MERDHIYDCYMTGWTQCFHGIDQSKEYDEGLERKAYNLGWSHYIMGDDLSHIDLLTKEEILTMIYKTD